MNTNVEKRVVSLNPFEVKDETVCAIKDEIMKQANDIEINGTEHSIDDITFVSTVVIDSTEDGGLDSHAEIFVPHDGGDE